MEADSGFEEWNALYTTQLTQKAKKYHDGIKRLMQIGSHARQMPRRVTGIALQALIGHRLAKQPAVTWVHHKISMNSRIFKGENQAAMSVEELTMVNRHLICIGFQLPILCLIFGNLFLAELMIHYNFMVVGFNRTSLHSLSSASWLSYILMQFTHFLQFPPYVDLQDGKSRSSDKTFIRREVGKSTFGNMDDSLRTGKTMALQKPWKPNAENIEEITSRKEGELALLSTGLIKVGALLFPAIERA